jgi:molecular chaperone GrpE (heat shock protein)
MRSPLTRRSHLDRLNEQLAELRDRSQTEVAELTEQLRSIAAELALTRAELESTAAERESTSTELESTTAELRTVRAQTREAQVAPAGAGQAHPPPVIRELVSMADTLTDLINNGVWSDPGGAETALRWFEERGAALLGMCDVTRIEDSGQLDLRRHEVVASRAAPSDEFADQIADTVRPGYAWHGSLLRPQQVIAYVPAVAES